MIPQVCRRPSPLGSKVSKLMFDVDNALAFAGMGRRSLIRMVVVSPVMWN